jgi:hypothetical protein
VADFEGYDALEAAFKAAARTAGCWGAGPRDLCIDITAGQKIFSIAGAIATLNRDTVFTYVNNAGEVASYIQREYFARGVWKLNRNIAERSPEDLLKPAEAN